MNENYRIVTLNHDGMKTETDLARGFDVGEDELMWIPKSVTYEWDQEMVEVEEWFALKEGLI